MKNKFYIFYFLLICFSGYTLKAKEPTKDDFKKAFTNSSGFYYWSDEMFLYKLDFDKSNILIKACIINYTKNEIEETPFLEIDFNTLSISKLDSLFSIKDNTIESFYYSSPYQVQANSIKQINFLKNESESSKNLKLIKQIKNLIINFYDSFIGWYFDEITKRTYIFQKINDEYQLTIKYIYADKAENITEKLTLTNNGFNIPLLKGNKTCLVFKYSIFDGKEFYIIDPILDPNNPDNNNVTVPFYFDDNLKFKFFGNVYAAHFFYDEKKLFDK